MSDGTSEALEGGEPKKPSAPPDSHSAHGSGEGEHAGHDHDHGHGEFPFLAHHFDTPQQQFDAGKLGIWLFLVQEVLFFAGLFCAYTIYRSQHPEIFNYAHYFLDTNMGAVNTIVLLFSSLTAAWAVRNAQLKEQRKLLINIVLTIACACTFMVVKYFEYSHKAHDGLLWGKLYDPVHAVWETPSFQKKHPEAAAAAERLIRIGEEAAKAKAAAPAKATAPIAEAKPIAEPTTLEPIASAQAPAIASAQAPAIASAQAPAIASAQAPAPAPVAAAAPIEPPKPAAAAPIEPPKPSPLAAAIKQLTPAEAKPLLDAGVLSENTLLTGKIEPPKNVHIFFGIYFFMTGLHGIHVLAGIIVWVWLLKRAMVGVFGPKYFGPIDFAALYWHLVDLVWIYLFPLLYLIH